jgi:hypothetical protein
MKWVLITLATASVACASGRGAAELPEGCAPDSTIYTYADTLRGVGPPLVVRALFPPRPGFGRVTAEGVVGVNGRVERGTLRTFGAGGIDERTAAGDALFWATFQPAIRDGCPVRFRYRITYMAGIPQRVPDEP